jgi:hypothetical protein
MSKYLPATLGIAAMLIASTALAKERSALESASVKAATDCVAAAALKDRNIVTLYRENRLKEITNRIVLQSSDCDNPLAAMRLLHDRLYGAGTGRTFLLGDYLADLPRAVGERIGGEVAKRIASQTVNDANAVQPLRVEVSHGNIFIQKGQQRLQLTRSGRDSEPILSPDKQSIVYTRLGGAPTTESDEELDCKSDTGADELRRIFIDGSGDEMLMRGQTGPERYDNVCRFSGKQFSSDGDGRSSWR